MPATATLARSIGWALQPIRPGVQRFAIRRRAFNETPATIEVTSPAFSCGGQIPPRYTSDGDNLSPPLAWRNLPAGTAALVLLVEDADAPALRPLVHAIVANIPPHMGGLTEGGIAPSARGTDTGGLVFGRNSLGRQGWLPITPPPGHGPHRYAFELFALDRMMRFGWPPGREHLLRAIRPHVLARGCLVGIYQRK